MKAGLLSIVVPFYNGGKCIFNLINSILESTYNNYEILIIDDGSTEVTDTLYDELSNLSSKIRVYHKSNGGIASARNYGVQKAKGEYLTFADQDDYVPENMYEELIFQMIRTNSDVAISNYKVCNKSFDEYTESNTISIDSVIEDDELDALRKWLVIGEVMPKPDIRIPSMVWNCIFKTDLVKANEIQFESFIRYDDDWVFLLRYLAICNRIYVTHNSYYKWLIHSDSESHTKKYLGSVSKKYSDLKQFKLDYLNTCIVSDKELIDFDQYFDVNYLYVAAVNESRNSENFNQFKKTLLKIVDEVPVDKLKSKSSIIEMLVNKKGKKAGLIVKLIFNRLYFFAYQVCKSK